MIQRFIELGEGYSDLYELLEIAKTNKDRVSHMLQFETLKNDKKYAHLLLFLNQQRLVISNRYIYAAKEFLYLKVQKVNESFYSRKQRNKSKKRYFFYCKTFYNFPRKRIIF